MRKIVSSVLAAVMLTAVFASAASAACNSNTNVAYNCFQEFKNAGQNVFRQQSEPDRAQTVNEAVRNCWNCATETLSNQMHDFNSTDSNSNNNSSSDDQ
jgi:hypothetical protein